MTQRILNLSRNHKLILLVRDDVSVPPYILKGDTVVVKNPFRNRIGRMIFPLFSVIKLINAHKKFKFDIFYTIHTYTVIPGFFMKYIARIRWVIDILDDPSLALLDLRLRKKKSPVRFVFLKIRDILFKRIIKYSDLVVTTGTDPVSGLPKILLNQYGIDPGKLLPVPNGIDLDKIRTKEETGKRDTFNIFYVGYVSALRGIDTLLMATKEIVNRIPNVKTILVGEARSEDRKWLNKTIEALGIEDHVEYLGVRENEEVQDMIKNSDICIFPFPNRPEMHCVYPIKVFEYLALEKPVVATRLEGVKSIIHDSYNGLLVQAGNKHEMADAICRIYSDRGLRENLKRNARKSIVPFDWRNINVEINRALTMFCSNCQQALVTSEGTD